MHKNIILLLISAFILIGCSEKPKENVKKEIIMKNVKVSIVKKQTYPIWVNFSGKTEAYKNVGVVSRVNGELKKIFFNVGDTVKKDQILFTIDDSEYKSILNQKEANLNKDKASLNLAIANVKRYTPLVEKQLAPKEKLDELIATQKQYEAVVDADIFAVKQAKLNVDYCTIKATINGKIGKNLVDIGNIVTSSTQLANITQSDYLFVNFNPSSNEVSIINKYKSQMHPKVKVLPENTDNEELALNGQIDFIDNVTNETTGTVAMRAKVDNKQQILFPGTFVEIQLFITDKTPIIAVHPNNISQNQLGSYVLVVNKENKIETKQIVISYSNNDLAIIKSGLTLGDRVVVSSINKLRNNQNVTVTEVPNPIKN